MTQKNTYYKDEWNAEKHGKSGTQRKKERKQNERKIVWNGIWFQIANNIDNDRLVFFLFDFFLFFTHIKYTWIHAQWEITLAEAKLNKMSKHSTTHTTNSGGQ